MIELKNIGWTNLKRIRDTDKLLTVIESYFLTQHQEIEAVSGH